MSFLFWWWPKAQNDNSEPELEKPKGEKKQRVQNWWRTFWRKKKKTVIVEQAEREIFHFQGAEALALGTKVPEQQLDIRLDVLGMETEALEHHQDIRLEDLEAGADKREFCYAILGGDKALELEAKAPEEQLDIWLDVPGMETEAPEHHQDIQLDIQPDDLEAGAESRELVDDFTELHKHYEVYETIGIGSFGEVKLGIHILTGEKVAIKIMDKKDDGDDMWCEINAMRNLHHRHVCQLYQVIETQNLVYLVLEYCPGGELSQLIVEKKRFTEVEARRFFRQIISALAYVHSKGYAHRDLKPENLLLDEHHNIKLIDFGGCAKPEGGLGSPLTTFCGTIPYIAPELYQDKPYIGSEADVWSLGVVLFTMLCGYLPFEAETFSGFSRQIVRGHFDIPDWLSFDSILLLKQMLQVNPKRRVTMEQLLDHKWVMKGYNSPVEWHSMHPVTIDEDCITEMVVLLLSTSELNADQLVSEWNDDHITAMYLILLAQNQRMCA